MIAHDPAPGYRGDYFAKFRTSPTFAQSQSVDQQFLEQRLRFRLDRIKRRPMLALAQAIAKRHGVKPRYLFHRPPRIAGEVAGIAVDDLLVLVLRHRVNAQVETLRQFHLVLRAFVVISPHVAIPQVVRQKHNAVRQILGRTALRTTEQDRRASENRSSCK
jgi:hypothetical protein